MVVDGLLGAHRRGCRLALLKAPERLGDHLGVRQQVVVHDLLDVLLGKLRLVCGRRVTRGEHGRNEYNETCDHEETHTTHRSLQKYISTHPQTSSASGSSTRSASVPRNWAARAPSSARWSQERVSTIVGWTAGCPFSATTRSAIRPTARS